MRGRWLGKRIALVRIGRMVCCKYSTPGSPLVKQVRDTTILTAGTGITFQGPLPVTTQLRSEPPKQSNKVARRMALSSGRHTEITTARPSWGGVSIGDHGFFVQDLEALPFTTPTDLQARKGYFFIGDKVLALGTHIRGGTSEDETHTTIFQTRLASADTPTGTNGDQFADLETLIRYPAGSTMAMTDSVGNGYFLASSTSDLFLSRQVQQSLSPEYEPTEGAFVQAYLNHGIKPLGDSYQYVVIPADPDGLQLQALAARPSDYYQVVEDGNIYVVYFPEQQITGYAFFELAETPNDQLVRRVNLPAVVMTQEDADGVTVAASVPDIGWQFDQEIVSHGLSYANNHFRHQGGKSTYPGTELARQLALGRRRGGSAAE